jgi:hypothetical protein
MSDCFLQARSQEPAHEEETPGLRRVAEGEHQEQAETRGEDFGFAPGLGNFACGHFGSRGGFDG